MPTPDPDQALRDAGAKLTAARAAVDEAMADVTAAVIAAKAAGDDIKHIASTVGISRPTVYGILEKDGLRG